MSDKKAPGTTPRYVRRVLHHIEELELAARKLDQGEYDEEMFRGRALYLFRTGLAYLEHADG